MALSLERSGRRRSSGRAGESREGHVEVSCGFGVGTSTTRAPQHPCWLGRPMASTPRAEGGNYPQLGRASLCSSRARTPELRTNLQAGPDTCRYEKKQDGMEMTETERFLVQMMSRSLHIRARATVYERDLRSTYRDVHELESFVTPGIISSSQRNEMMSVTFDVTAGIRTVEDLQGTETSKLEEFPHFPKFLGMLCPVLMPIWGTEGALLAPTSVENPTPDTLAIQFAPNEPFDESALPGQMTAATAIFDRGDGICTSFRYFDTQYEIATHIIYS